VYFDDSASAARDFVEKKCGVQPLSDTVVRTPGSSWIETRCTMKMTPFTVAHSGGTPVQGWQIYRPSFTGQQLVENRPDLFG
jgi:hypothetical protein